MTNDKIAELERKYPFMDDPNDSEMSFAYGVPMGWLEEFDKMCGEVVAALEEVGYDAKRNFKFVQVKEKFGELRVYWTLVANDEDDPEPQYNPTYEKISEIVDRHCTATGKMCCRCGEPATKKTKGWVRPYCEPCFKEFT